MTDQPLPIEWQDKIIARLLQVTQEEYDDDESFYDGAIAALNEIEDLFGLPHTLNAGIAFLAEEVKELEQKQVLLADQIFQFLWEKEASTIDIAKHIDIGVRDTLLLLMKLERSKIIRDVSDKDYGIWTVRYDTIPITMAKR